MTDPIATDLGPGRTIQRVPPNNNEEQHDFETPQYRELVIDEALKPLHVTLKPPIEFDGQQYHELILDFDGQMNGKFFQRCEREFTHLYKPDRNESVVLPELKHLFHSIIAKNLANVPIGVIASLPRRIYVPLRSEVAKACGNSSEEDKV